MKKISEEFLHFLWKNQSLTGITITEANGLEVEVLNPGEHNHDAGPDFFNARVRIGGTTWAGNVEIHINASDWLHHGHQHDPVYDSVILHVVYFNDCVITRSNNEPLLTVLIRFPVILWDTYEKLLKKKSWIACGDDVGSVDSIRQVQWTSSLLVEKLASMHDKINLLYAEENCHWDALLNRLLFRCFGTPVNTLPFEMLSSRIPFTTLLRSKQDQQQLEALLFGEAGMLAKIPQDKYTERLQQEYLVFSSRKNDSKMQEQLWKFMRLRPSSFPTIRIAQLAAFIHTTYPLAEKLKQKPTLKELQKLLTIRAGDYWNNHYLFGKESAYRIKYTGQDFSRMVIINGLAPYQFSYGRIINDQSYCDHAIALLEKLPAENNIVIKNWRRQGIRVRNAFESQALLQLYKQYCKNKRCLECQFGNHLIIHGRKQRERCD